MRCLPPPVDFSCVANLNSIKNNNFSAIFGLDCTGAYRFKIFTSLLLAMVLHPLMGRNRKISYKATVVTPSNRNKFMSPCPCSPINLVASHPPHLQSTNHNWCAEIYMLPHVIRASRSRSIGIPKIGS